MKKLALSALVLVIGGGVMTASGDYPGGSAEKHAADLLARGAFEDAVREAERLLKDVETEEAGLRLLVLTTHLTGDYRGSISWYDRLGERSRIKNELAETVIWSHFHLGDIEGALRRFRGVRFPGDRAFKAILERFRERPMRVQIPGVVELPFTEDALTPYMPGFPMKIEGRRAVGRLDTGGSFVHVSASLAKDLGIKALVKTRGFAALTSDTIGYGFADIELGAILLSNVPVLIHERGLPAQAIAAAFDVELGPIIGTNILERFLATVDGPGKRLILSGRGNADMKRKHEALLGGDGEAVPFALWQDHYLIVHGDVGGSSGVGMFVDSGLVVVDAEQGQASMLTPYRILESWKVIRSDQAFTEIPGGVRIGDATAYHATAYAVSDKLWKRFGDWGGVRVDTLLSWGFLKEFAWTLDFDERHLLFRKR